jgi:uncharacterized repeat protein (TIGR01451 family)
LVRLYASASAESEDVPHVPWDAATSAVVAHPGDVVEFRLEFDNTGNTTIGGEAGSSVIVQALIQDNLEYVPGSSRLVNANNLDGLALITEDVGVFTNPDGGNDFLVDPQTGSYTLAKLYDEMTIRKSKGLRVGAYGPHSNCIMTFRARILPRPGLTSAGHVGGLVSLWHTKEAGTRLATAAVTIVP